MTKKFIAILFALMLCVLSVVPCFAQGDLPRLVDDLDVLSVEEETELLGRLDAVSEAHQFDLVVVIVEDFAGMSAMDYADDFFDYNGYGFGDNRDGSLLLIGVNEDYRWISTSGFGITAFTDAGIQYIGSEIVYDIQSAFYYDAIDTYITLCDDFLTQAENGIPYDSDNLPKGKFPFFFSLLFSVAIGFVIGFIVVLILKSQLKTVRREAAATSYLKVGSMKVTDSKDMFLYRNVQKVKKAENNSSGGSSVHTSSSGRTHGGGGF